MLAVRDVPATVTPTWARAGKETMQEPGACTGGLPSSEEGEAATRGPRRSTLTSVPIRVRPARRLADAVNRIAGPDERTGGSFPHRARAGAPRLPGLRLSGSTSPTAPQGAVLGAGLRCVLEITETAMGNVRLADVPGT